MSFIDFLQMQVRTIRNYFFGIINFICIKGTKNDTNDAGLRSMSRKFVLNLPPSISNPNLRTVANDGVVVIIGANGSGKSRLGEWIEFKSSHAKSIHRVSAQKSLAMPEVTKTTSVELAQADLFFGDDKGKLDEKLHYRWHRNPSTYPLDDYAKLMVYLFSEEFEQSIKYRQAARATLEYVDPPETKLDKVRRIWESVLPLRQLEVDGGRIQAMPRGNLEAAYNGSQMSDGERVIFYLIGQSLSAPPNGVIVLDEPELHLHKSLQAALWDAIEAERPDCQFVYITHDLDFAMTRSGAPKVCVRSYDGAQWDWYEAPQNDDIPEEVLLQIIGGRKPVLFVEGDKNSLDHFILRLLFPKHSIVPMASCHHVIHATASFTALSSLHNLHCYGIVDRDYRPDEEIAHLGQMKVFSLDVAEIENLFLIEGVLQVVAAKLLREDFPCLMQQVRDKIFSQLEADKVKVASAVTAAAMERKLSALDNKAQKVAGLTSALNKLVNHIDVDFWYRTALDEVEQILANRDYEAALKLYSNKGLIPQVSPIFGFRHPEMLSYIKRLLSTHDGEPALEAMRGAIPKLS